MRLKPVAVFIINHIVRLALPLVRRFNRRALRPSYLPSKIIIGLAGRCIMSCSFCDVNALGKKYGLPNGLTPEDMVFKALDEVLALNPRMRILFALWGDPLQHPKLVEFIRHAKSRSPDCVVWVKTNGELLTPKLSAELAGAGLDCLSISLDTFSSSTYDAHRKPNIHAKVLANARNFKEACLAVASETQLAVQFIYPILIEDRGSLPLAYNYRDVFDLVQVTRLGLLNSDRQYPDQALVHHYEHCGQPFGGRLTLWPNGWVGGCCGIQREDAIQANDLIWGEFPKSSLLEILHSAKADLARDQLKTRRPNKIPLSCRTCVSLKEEALPLEVTVGYDDFLETYVQPLLDAQKAAAIKQARQEMEEKNT